MGTERYDQAMTCPQCRHTGTARISENDHPFMRRLDRTVVSFPDGFEDAGASGKEDVTRVLCKCGYFFDH